jgi:choice-of-anchor A domain-containing protein
VRIGGNAQQVKANGGGSVFVDGSINTLEIGGGGTAQVGGGVTALKAGSNTNVQVGGSVGGLDMQGAGAVVGVGANTNNFNGASGGILKTNTKSGYANANGATVTSGLGLGWNAGDLTGLNQTSGVAAETAQLGLDLAALSQTFAGLTVATNHSTANFLSNKLTLNAVGEPEGFALFNLDASKLTGTDLAYNFAPGDYSVIINVTGLSAVNSVLNWNMNPAAGGSAFNQRIIWNFADAAGTVHFNRMVNGSVLAPFATVSNTTPIEGSVAVKAFNMGGEIHLGTFAGNPIPSAVPEPSSWAMMLAGVGALGATLRRRRRTQPAMAAA